MGRTFDPMPVRVENPVVQLARIAADNDHAFDHSEERGLRIRTDAAPPNGST